MFVPSLVSPSQDEAVKRLFLSLSLDPQGSVLELSGHAVVCVLPFLLAGDEQTAAVEWTEETNTRRCALIDR